VRDQEYFGYDGDDRHTDTSDNPDYMNETGPHGNEMARNAVERFLESESSDYMAGYDSRRTERPERPERASRPEEHPSPGTLDDAWRPASPPNFEYDDEFMNQLANVRRERPRRREQNPAPKPAVRVNAERRRRVPVATDRHEVDGDWVSPDDDDYNTFRPRPSGPDIMSPPKEARVKEPRPRGSVPVHRREPDLAEEVDGTTPLRYLLAVVFVGVLALMAFLALNNRNLRRDLSILEAQAAEVDDNAEDLERANLEIAGYQTLLEEYRAENEALYAQLNDLGHAVSDVTPDYTPGYTPSRPVDESPGPEEPHAPPPVAEPVIHVVLAGQVLSRIANMHYGSTAQVYIDKIVAANNLTNPNSIREGQELIIPPRE